MIRFDSERLSEKMVKRTCDRLTEDFADFQWSSPQSFFYRGCGECIILVGFEPSIVNNVAMYQAYAFTDFADLESFSVFFESPYDAVFDAVRSLLDKVNKIKLSEV